MRPQSVVGMVAAALLMVVGLILCLVASGMAKKADVQLFPVTEGGNTKTQKPAFTDDGITKIELTFADAKVNVIGGQEESFIELKNFDENSYSYTVSGKTITLTEMQGVFSMLKFWENGFAFKGVRNILWSTLGLGDKITGDKVVNIYLSDATRSLNNLQLHLTGCDVSLENVSLSTDFVLNVDSSVINVQKITGNSKLEIIAGKDVTLHLADSSFSTLLVSGSDDGKKPVPTAYLDLTNAAFADSNINLSSGSVALTLDNNNPLEGGLENYDFDLASSGTILFAGKTVASPYTKVGIGGSKSKLKVTAGDAPITITTRKS